jgi:hypothetical protein
MRVRQIGLWTLVCGILLARAAAGQAPLPPGWPTQLELGMADSPGGASAMRATAPFRFRYQYLAGGVNTGSGWSTWNTNADFPTFYIQDSLANGVIPVFTYYMLLQSKPGGGGEPDAVFTNVNTTATMTAYYNDLALFFRKAGAFAGQRVVLHVEPDFWGYMQQRSTADNAATVPAKVSETSIPALQGLPSTVAGFAQAVVRLRDLYAPNVTLAYHLSVWGTNVDIALSDPPDTAVDALAARAASFYTSLHADFDLSFAEFSDRDAAFKEAIYGDGGASWWDAEDFRRSARFLKGFSAAAHKRLVMWQIPYGNTRMRTQNNAWGHYQDNRVEWLLDDPTGTHLLAYRDAGVVAFLFGGGANGVTCACDANGDGVTNPGAIDGNTIASELAAPGTPPSHVLRGSVPTLVTPYAADDDGGYFRWRAWTYYQSGAIVLGKPPRTPTGLHIVDTSSTSKR